MQRGLTIYEHQKKNEHLERKGDFKGIIDIISEYTASEGHETNIVNIYTTKKHSGIKEWK